MPTLAERYQRDGFVSPVRVIDAAAAARHRSVIESAERQVGNLHYRDKTHLALRSTFDLATHPVLLDAVAACIGPDIMLYNTNYIIKEPATATNVTWHQDLTYWGLADDDAQVSAWLAIEPASIEAGCMRMIPGSQTGGRREHENVEGGDNVLLLGQRIPDVDESMAVPCPLEPGEMSLHHGWTLHASAPNTSSHRRIGLNIQFLAPHNRHQGDQAMAATLVRGKDRYGYFESEIIPESDLEPAGIARWRYQDKLQKQSYQTLDGTS